MVKIPVGRISAILFFLLLTIGASFSLHNLVEDIVVGKYFTQPEELHFEIAFIISYIFIIILLLRYGYYLAKNQVNWLVIKDDFLYVLNRKYFSQRQWLINVLLFWISLIGFIYALAISTMKGHL